MAKVNFKKIEFELVDGTKQPLTEDFAKLFGNALYNSSRDVADADLARDIYYGKDVEVKEEQKAFILSALESIGAIYPVKAAVMGIFK